MATESRMGPIFEILDFDAICCFIIEGPHIKVKIQIEAQFDIDQLIIIGISSFNYDEMMGFEIQHLQK